MRQKVRKTLIIIFFLLFPLTMNYISPYVPIDGATEGFITISLFVFVGLLLSSIFLGRSWCSWLCPVAGFHEICIGINDKKVNIKKLRMIRYIVFIIWLSVIILMFILVGGIKAINLFYLTETGVSVDMPAKFIIYYGVLAIVFILNIIIGSRGMCHSICWMSPFMTAGIRIGKFLKLPRIKLDVDKQKCISCGICNKKCQMSLDVTCYTKRGEIDSNDCILCCECMDNCPKKAIKIVFK